VPSPDEQLKRLTRNAVDVLPAGELESKLKLGRPLRVKLGLDPGAVHVTLGWTVPLRKLREFQDLGHTAVLIVGDYTAQIGDPSEKESTRPMLSKEQVEENTQRVLDQFSLVLADENLEIRRNSEWLDALGTTGLLELSTHYTVARMLERDDFAKRFASSSPISIREFLYPLLQAYDSVAVEADVELGGSDQHFNLMVGRAIQRVYGQDPQVVMTMPLIEGTDGVKKMSQSLGNYIGITEPPDEIFGRLMRLPDHLMEKYFRLITSKSDEEIAVALTFLPQNAKRSLAEAVVSEFHGKEAAAAARERFDKLFVEHETPDDVPDVEIPADAVDGGKVYLPRVIAGIGFASSASEARRLIGGGGVYLDGVTVSAEEFTIDELRGRLLRVGKRRFARLV
jgi:tyrosyl-tRNA synthetase